MRKRGRELITLRAKGIIAKDGFTSNTEVRPGRRRN
jgi:hypothetical protein